MLTSKVPLIFCFDIDETLCTSPGIDYELAMPINERIVKVNSLYAEGHTIKLYTARGSKTGKDLRVLTKNQLKAWGLNYHELAFGKPFADFYIDDKAINSDNFDWA